MNKLFLSLSLLLLIFSSCAKKGHTPAQVKLKVAGIVDMNNGIGSGGAILFGVAKTGESFGQVVLGSEENIELPNGEWNFYALMWEKNANSTQKLAATIYCGKSTQILSGTDATVNMNLTNSTCSDATFASNSFTDSLTSKIRFPEVFVEECDELNASVTAKTTCGLDNQGSALSYRAVFRNFKKSSNGIISFAAGELSSSCMKVDRAYGVLNHPLPLNLPNGSSQLPIPVEIKLYPGNDNCNESDPKGVMSVSLEQGVHSRAKANGEVINYNTAGCSLLSSALVGTTPEETQDKCQELMGVLNAGSCNLGSIPSSVVRFLPTSFCATGTIQPGTGSSGIVPAVKHLVTIAHSTLCSRYDRQSTIIGSHPFAGGDGSMDRPYKICNEWQINQIGAASSPSSYSNAHYKLLNDLDMNSVDIGGATSATAFYTAPACAKRNSNATPTDLDIYHNFNPLDKIVDSSCSKILMDQSFNGFQGVFNGYNKTIRNMRIFGKNVEGVGFVRKLHAGAVIKNINFSSAMVEGRSYVGAIAGTVEGSGAQVKNISIKKANIFANENSSSSSYNTAPMNIYVAGVAGDLGADSVIKNVHISEAHIFGGDYVAGLVGRLNGSLFNSSFRGSIKQLNEYGGNAGGLVAAIPAPASGNNPGEIRSSFSEGIIESQTRHLGGIVGYSNGLINGVYSTMVVKNDNDGYTYPGTTNHFVGGVVGYADGGVLANLYYDGAVSVTTPTVLNSAVGSIIGSYYGTLSVSNCVAKGPTTGHHSCAVPTAQNPLTSGTRTDLSSNIYNQMNGSLPRLAWESRVCIDAVNQASVAAQSTNGRGSEANPIIICNSSQLSQISGRSSSEHYKIEDDINLSSWVESDLISQLNGSLSGQGKILYNFKVTPAYNSSASYLGMIKSLASTGMMKDLKIYSSTLDASSMAVLARAGLLVGSNEGVIKNIFLNDVSVMSKADTSGIIAGYNSGTISKVKIENGSIKGTKKMGGAVGLATTTSMMDRLNVNAEVGLAGNINAYTAIGGLVGSHEGLLQQSRYQGVMALETDQSFVSGTYAGMLAAYNGGSITNSLVDLMSSVNFHKIQYVGGMVGYNTGTLDRSLTFGKVISHDIVFDPYHYFLPTISAGNYGSNVFYLDNMLATRLGAPNPQTMQIAALSNSGLCQNIFSTSPTDGYVNYLLATDANKANLLSFDLGSSLAPTLLVPVIVPASLMIEYSLGGNSCIPSGAQLTFYKKPSLTFAQEAGKKSFSDFKDITMFSNFNIAGKTSSGNRIKEIEMLSYYKAIMYEQTIPATAPIWLLDDFDDSPQLLQLESLYH